MANRQVLFVFLLVTCSLTTGSLTSERSVEILRPTDASSWFGVGEADEENLVTTPIADKMESVHVSVENDTATYDDEDYFNEEVDDENITSDGHALKDEESEYSEMVSSSPDLSNASVIAGNSSSSGNVLAIRVKTTSNATSAIRVKTTSNTTVSHPEGRSLNSRPKPATGKMEEVNYWQTDGSSDQQTSGSAKATSSEEGKDEMQVSVKEHDRNPHPLAFSSSGDNEWFGFGGGGSASGSSGGTFQASHRGSGSLGGSASVAVEDYQTKEMGGTKDSELESAVEIKEHDELAPGAHGGGFASPSSDGQWFSDFGSHDSAVSKNSKTSSAPSSGGGGSGGDDVWFGVESSDWQPMASSNHRQQRKLNWGEDDGVAPATKDYEDIDIITAPPNPGKSRDIFSFVVESSLGGGRSGKGSGKKDTDGIAAVEIITAPPDKQADSDMEWFGSLQKEDVDSDKKIVVKSQTSTTTVRSTVIGRSRISLPASNSTTSSGVNVNSEPQFNPKASIVSRNHSFIDLLAKKSGATVPPSSTTQKPLRPLIASFPRLSEDVGKKNKLVVNLTKESSTTVTPPPVQFPVTRLPELPEDSGSRNKSEVNVKDSIAEVSSTMAAPLRTTTSVRRTTSTPPSTTSTAVPRTTTATSTEGRTPDSRYWPDGLIDQATDEISFAGPKRTEENDVSSLATNATSRSGRKFGDSTSGISVPTKSQNSDEKVAADPSNFTVAAAASENSETRDVLGTNALQDSADRNRKETVVAGHDGNMTSENLSYILVGTCCGVSLICLVIVVTVYRYRKFQQRLRRSLHEPFRHSPMYSPTSYSYPPASRLGHSPSTWSDRSYQKDARSAKVAPPPPPPLPDSKARMWFMGRKQSPYSLCDQHLSYCSNRGYAHDTAPDYTKLRGLQEAAPPPEAGKEGGGNVRRNSDPVYRTGFNGLSDARHSSGLDYMNKGEMIYWSSNNEQLI